MGPSGRRQLGLHFVPEERLGRGAVPSMSLAHNLLLTRSESLGPAGWIRTSALAEQARGLIERFRVKAGGPQAPAQSLSGGNLQKFIVGREIEAQPRLLIVSQPTWGVDVGAAAQIRGEILALRERKLNHLQALQVTVIASANIGCLTHLQAGTELPVRHWIEVLDEALSA